jgi:hypothetical protein
MLVSYLAYSYAIKTEAKYIPETSVGFKRTTWRYVTEDRTIHNHRCENLKSYHITHIVSNYKRKHVTYCDST